MVFAPRVFITKKVCFNCVVLSHTVGTVSYTHLDVYKRQNFNSFRLSDFLLCIFFCFSRLYFYGAILDGARNTWKSIDLRPFCQFFIVENPEETMF